MVLVTQGDHAALAGAFLEHWQADGLPDHPQRARIIEATRVHDVGWEPEDECPRLDPTSGLPYDFITLPEDIRQAVWPRAVAALRDTPYEAALVAQHALTLYRRYEADAAYQPFLREMAHERDTLFQRCQETMPEATLGSFLQAYAWLSIADLLSLIVCHGWTEAYDADQYRAVLAGAELRVAPDPFASTPVPFRVAGRRLPRRTYTSDDDLRDAYALAPTVWLSGTLVGSP